MFDDNFVPPVLKKKNNFMCIYVYIQNEMWKIGTEIHLAELNGVFGPELKKKKSTEIWMLAV